MKKLFALLMMFISLNVFSQNVIFDDSYHKIVDNDSNIVITTSNVLVNFIVQAGTIKIKNDINDTIELPVDFYFNRIVIKDSYFEFKDFIKGHGIYEISFENPAVSRYSFNIDIKITKSNTYLSTYYFVDASKDLNIGLSSLVVGGVISMSYVLVPIELNDQFNDKNKTLRCGLIIGGVDISIYGVIKLFTGSSKIKKAGIYLDRERRVQLSNNGIGLKVNF